MVLYGWISLAFIFCFPSVIATRSQEASDPPCRFSSRYTIDEIVRNPAPFEQDVLFWEGKFHQLNVSLNTYNGMTYDGTLIDPVNGTRTAKHPFSAASKEVTFHAAFHVILSAP